MEEERPPPRDDERRKRRTASGGSPSKGKQGEKESEEETEDLTVVSGYIGGSPNLANPPAYENPISDPPAHENPISPRSTDSSVRPPLERHASTSRGLSGGSPFKKKLKLTSPSGKTKAEPGPSSSGHQGQSVSSEPSLASKIEESRNLLVPGDNETSSITLNLLNEMREFVINQPRESLVPPKPSPNVFATPSKRARSGTPSKDSRSPLAYSQEQESTRSSDTAGAGAKTGSSHKRPESLNLTNPLSTELLSEAPQTAEIEMSSIPMASAEPRYTTIQTPPAMLAEEQEQSRLHPSTSVLLEGNLSGQEDHNLSPTDQSESKMLNLSPLEQFSSDYSPSPERQPSENAELLGIADNMHRCFDCAGYFSRSSCNNCIRNLYRSIHEKPISATSSPSNPVPPRLSPLCPGFSPERRYYLGPLYISPRQPRNQYSIFPDATRDMTGHFGSPGTPENYFKPDTCGVARSPNKCCACIGYRLMSENPWLNPFRSTSSPEHQTESPSKSSSPSQLQHQGGSPVYDTSPKKLKSPDSGSKSLIPCRVCLQRFKKEKLRTLPVGDFGDPNIVCMHCFDSCKNRVPSDERQRRAHISPKKGNYIKSVFPKLGIRRRLVEKGTPDEKPKRSSLSPLKDLFSPRKKKYSFEKDSNKRWESGAPSRPPFERNLEASAAGTSYGAAGTSYGAAGTSYGAAGTSYGAAGTSYGAAGTSYGAAGTSFGAAGTSYGAAGTSYGAAGTSLGAADDRGYSVGLPGVYVLPYTGIYFPESDTSSPIARRSLEQYFSRTTLLGTRSHMLPGAPLEIPGESSAIRGAQHPPLPVAQHLPLPVAQHLPLPVAQHLPLPVVQQPPLTVAQHQPDPEAQSSQRTKDKSESFKRKLGFVSRNKKDKKKK